MSVPARTDETSAGGVVYRLDRGRTLYLLIRDSYRNWGFPKGHLEDGERPEDAALREVAEETGLTDLAVRAPIDIIDWYFRFHGRVVHKTCHFFLMETTQSTTSRVGQKRLRPIGRDVRARSSCSSACVAAAVL